MGRGPHCSKDGLNKGAWTSQEDKILTDYVKVHGEGRWSNVAKRTGLKRCGKSCRLRWMNYLRPGIKRGNISVDEEELIVRLHKLLGNRWSLIAGRLPGRTDNEIKNYWNTNLAKKAQDCVRLTLPKLSNNPRPLHEEVPTPPPPNYGAIKPDANAPVQNHIGNDQLRQYDPTINVGTPENDNVVLQSVRIHGEGTTCSTVDHSPPSSIAGDENNKFYSSDQLMMNMDFNMDEFCKILDSDFTRIGDGHDVGNSVPVLGEEGHEVGLNINGDVEVADVPPKKFERNWSDESAQVDQAEGSDFMSLISFLDSVPEEWQEII